MLRKKASGSYVQVAQLEGGVYGWYKADLPFDGEGEYDTSDIGKTPNAAPSPPEYVRANSK